MATAPGADGWTLELGCGHGHYLTAFAAHHPDATCLGIDFCRERVRRAERKLQRARLANLCFLHAEAGEFLDALPPDMRFRRIFVLFPDPWPKRRHRKHRLVSPEFLDRTAGLAMPQAGFFFRSDALDYVEEVRANLAKHPSWRLIPDGNLPFETETVFQAKARLFGSVVASRVG